MNVNIEDIKRPCNMLDEAGYWRARAVIGSNKLLIRLRAEHDCNMRLPEGRMKKHRPKPEAPLIPIVYPVLPKDEPGSPTHIPSARSIQDAVASYYGITRNQLIGHRRIHKFMIPRHVAVYICRQLTKFSTLQLGRFFGGKDHTSMINSERRIEAAILTDSDLAFDIATLIERITGVQQ